MKDYNTTAKEIRKDVTRVLARRATGHTAANLAHAEIFTALYFKAIKHNPRQPNWEERDRVLASRHLLPIWNVALAHAGYFGRKNLYEKVAQLEIPEGQTLSVATGTALANSIDGKKNKTYCVISDFEHDNGQIWEAIMLAGKYKLNNLTLIIGRTTVQADGYTEQVMPLEPLRSKYEAFNWHVIEVDGHNITHIIDALKEESDKPTAIIAHAIPGKGVSFIENKHEWHAKAPTEEQAKIALTELQHA